MKRDRLLIGFDGRAANEPQRAGIGNYCSELLQALAALDEEVTLRVYLDRTPQPGLPTLNGPVDVVVLPSSRAWTQRALANALRRNPPDVFLSPGIQIPLFAPCPCVPTVLDLAYFTFPACFPRRTRIANRLYARLALRQAAHVVAISEATKHDIVRLLNIAPENITVAHLGVSSAFRTAPTEDQIDHVRRSLTLPEHYVLYVGTLQPRKNLARLIDAFSRLRQQHPELPHHLVIAGKKGWLYDDIFRAAAQSPAHPFIHVLDFVPQEELPALITAADALALVSLSEGFGLPVIEAMACGTPVLASNTSSLPEIAGAAPLMDSCTSLSPKTTANAALLVDPCDTGAIHTGLERILLDNTLRAHLQTRGPLESSRFTWQRTARTIMNTLRAVTQPRHNTLD